MFARRQPVVEAMDRTAQCVAKSLFWLFRTDISQPGKPRPALSYRYLPLALLLVCAAGLGIISVGWVWFGMAVFNVAWLATCFIQLSSPLAASWGQRDERETALFRLGHMWGLFAVAIVAVLGCFYFGIAAPMPGPGHASVGLVLTGLHLWFPTQAIDWMELAMFLLAVEINVAVLVSSWNMPRDPADLD